MQEIIEIITIKNIIIYFFAINLIGLLAMKIDKVKAKKNIWRIKEGTLMLISLFGGSIGTICGMYLFRHKTKKMKFSVGLPTILILQIVLIFYLIINCQ